MISRIGQYHILKALGAGGMAQTFVAVRKGPAGFEQKVCIKRILPEHVCDRAFVEQFMDEARLLARLQHAGIVQVLDFGEVLGIYYMSLELVEGCDLATLLRQLQGQNRTLPILVTMHIAAKLLAALSYAHHAELDGEPLHLVHRDVSPSNLLLSRNGEVKLADFGIAKFKQRNHQTRTGYIKGKATYMSPEQVRAEPLDARSDLFAVGVVLYEALTGTHPFAADSDHAVLTNILKGHRPPIRSLAPDLPDAVVRLVDALLELKRENRPTSASEALEMVPAEAQLYARQRELAAIVSECSKERERGERASPHAGTQPLKASRRELAAREATQEHCAGERSPAAREATITYRRNASEEPDDGVELSPRPSRSSGLVTISFLLATAVAVGAWVTLSASKEKPPALPARSQVAGERSDLPKLAPAMAPVPAQAGTLDLEDEEPELGLGGQDAEAVILHAPEPTFEAKRPRPSRPAQKLSLGPSSSRPAKYDTKASQPTPLSPRQATSATQSAPSIVDAPRARRPRPRGSPITEDEF